MQSLYNRIGGEETVDHLITGFYQRILSDHELAPFFENSSIDKLIHMQKAFFAAALDGPPLTTKLELYEIHRGRGITRQHLTRFTDHLIETLRDVGVNDDDAKSVYQRISLYANEVLGESSVDG